MIKRLLIANRGEIAVRIIKAARAEGIETVSVYSDADQDAFHTQLADQSVCIGPAPAAQSYLNIDAILKAAHQTAADAVHPGYGFLSENADFACAVGQAGLIFVGPSPDVIEQMGDKATARRLAQNNNVPVVPGFDGIEASDEQLEREAQTIGAPLMIKATAGGGGRGMRQVRDLAEFKNALESAKREAKSAFGNDQVMLEKLVENARHVEVQILADQHGTILHLGERDCSAQRRHQKVIEEAPCATIGDTTRNKLTTAAINLAAAVSYMGAGTVEFLVDEDNNIYFLEMNTRLQVEHPVTEMVTGIDLVAEQLRIAGGEPLSVSQNDVTVEGHAIETRLYAEDPANAFLPQTGTLGTAHFPEGTNLRIDTGVRQGDVVSPHYDPMLAKLVAFGSTREKTIERLRYLLQHTAIAGITTNKGYLTDLVASSAFRDGTLRTGSLDKQTIEDRLPKESKAAIAGAILLRTALRTFPHQSLSGWSTLYEAYTRLNLEIDGEQYALALSLSGDAFNVQIGDTFQNVQIHNSDSLMEVHVNDTMYNASVFSDGDTLHIDLGISHFSAKNVTHRPPATQKTAGNGKIAAPMDGQVVAVHKTPGEAINEGDLILVIEAMKMEHQLRADIAGTLMELTAVVGEQVKSKQHLAIISQPNAQEGATA